LRVTELGPSIHAFDFDVTWDQADHDRGHAEYYVLAVPARFAPSSEHWTADEHVDVTDHRWVTADELEAAGEPFEPAHLPELIRRAVSEA